MDTILCSPWKCFSLIKYKLMLSHCIPWTLWLYSCITWEPYGGEWSASFSGCFGAWRKS
jgi:hypothetical protein